MKNKIILFTIIPVLLSFGNEVKTTAANATNINTNIAAKTNVVSETIERETPRRRRRSGVETFLNPKEWQSGIGYKEMQRYLKRLAHLCEDRIPGLVNGIAAGKRGVLLNVTFKGQKSFYMARENTEEFLTAIIGDLEKMPEPVAPAVYVTHNKHTIITAIKKNGKVKVKFLL